MTGEMTLYSDLFYANEFNDLLSNENLVQRMLDVEASLAEAQGELGVIPKSASEAIKGCCKLQFVDLNRLKEEVPLGGNAAIPLARQLVRIVKNNDFESSKYVHYGATSQDIIDTALSLTIKEVNKKVVAKLADLENHLADLVTKYRKSVMIGRTLLQQGKPITFGLKAAYWLNGVMNNKKKLKDIAAQVECIQLGGAVASGGPLINRKVRSLMADKLGLKDVMPWQSDRSSLVLWASNLGTLNGYFGKIAKDVSLLMQTEVGEVLEGAEKGKGGSSTMPHKRNPVTSSAILSNAHQMPHLISSLMAGLVQEHERAAGLWHAEWEVVNQVIKLVGGSLIKTTDLVKNLEVNEKKMGENLEATNGLIYAENVLLALATKIGKNNAHEWVRDACQLTIAKKRHLKEIVRESEHQLENLDELFNPQNSLGDSLEIADHILKSYEDQL